MCCSCSFSAHRAAKDFLVGSRVLDAHFIILFVHVNVHFTFAAIVIDQTNKQQTHKQKQQMYA